MVEVEGWLLVVWLLSAAYLGGLIGGMAAGSRWAAEENEEVLLRNRLRERVGKLESCLRRLRQILDSQEGDA